MEGGVGWCVGGWVGGCGCGCELPILSNCGCCSRVVDNSTAEERK